MLDLRVGSEAPQVRDSARVEADARSWPAIVRGHVETSRDYVAALLECADLSRTAWKVLLDLRPDASVLEVGAGTGLVASSIAPHVARVVAADFKLAELLLAVRRLRTFNPEDDVTVVLLDREGRLPFPDGSFDSVVLSEMPDSRSPAAPDLARLASCLKPDGQFFWIAGNRLSHENWRPALSSLLRLRIRGSSSARSGEMTYFGYGRALRRAGYETFRWFSVPGVASGADRVEPLIERASAVWDRAAPRGWRARLKSHLYAANQYGILASKSSRVSEGVLARILAAIGTGLDEDRPLRVTSFAIGRKDKIILTVQTQGTGSPLIVRIPLSGAARESDRVNATMLRRLRTNDEIRSLVPHALLRGEVDSFSFCVESHLPGRPLSLRMATLGLKQSHRAVARVMDRVNPTGGPDPRYELTGEAIHQDVASEIPALRLLGVSEDTVAHLQEYFRIRLDGSIFPGGIQHGDFSASNVLLDESDEVCGLIDWESGSSHGLPILDAIHYVETVERRRTRARSGTLIPRIAAGSLADETTGDFLTDRYRRWSIDPKLHEPLVYLKWVRQMVHLSRFWLAFDQRSIDDLVTPVVDAIRNAR